MRMLKMWRVDHAIRMYREQMKRRGKIAQYIWASAFVAITVCAIALHPHLF